MTTMINIQPENESKKLFLLEVLVDNLCITHSSLDLNHNLEANVTDICVLFQFLHYPPLVICESDFIGFPVVRKETSKIAFKVGKSCIFSLSVPPGPKLATPFEVNVSAIYKMRENILPDKLEVGKTCIDMGDSFTHLLSVNTDDICETLPLSKSTKGIFDLKNENGTVIGNLTAFVRLSCFGKLIITQFSLNTDDSKTFFFKGTDMKQFCHNEAWKDLNITGNQQVDKDKKSLFSNVHNQRPASPTIPDTQWQNDLTPQRNICDYQTNVKQFLICETPTDRRHKHKLLDTMDFETQNTQFQKCKTPCRNLCDAATDRRPRPKLLDTMDFETQNTQFQKCKTPCRNLCEAPTDRRPRPKLLDTMDLETPFQKCKTGRISPCGASKVRSPKPIISDIMDFESQNTIVQKCITPRVNLCDCSYARPQNASKSTPKCEEDTSLAPGEVCIHDDQVIFQLPLKKRGGPQEKQAESAVCYKLTTVEETEEGQQNNNTVHIKSEGLPRMAGQRTVGPMCGPSVEGDHDVFLLKIGKKCEGDQKRNLELELRTPKVKEPKPPMTDGNTQCEESDFPKVAEEKESVISKEKKVKPKKKGSKVKKGKKGKK